MNLKKIRALSPDNFNLSFPCLSGMDQVEAAIFADAAECVETDAWAVDAILRAELMTPDVVDPCCGPGVIARVSAMHGYNVIASDLHDWGFGHTGVDFLEGRYPYDLTGKTVLMNAPFSLACEFIERARYLGARKIVNFQRLAWKESGDRRAWWAANLPQREYVCGMRAHCFYPIFSAKYRKGRTNTMAMAFYVWEQGQPAGPISGVIFPHPDFKEAV